MNKKVNKTTLVLLLLLPIIFGCGKGGKKIKVNGIKSEVVKILKGNEVELKNGLKVEILGIKPTEITKNWLESQVLGEKVTVIADSKQKKTISTYKTKVKAYLKEDGEAYCISGKLLRSRTATLRSTAVKDSLEHFTAYVKDPDRIVMSSSELREFMRPATFLIATEHGMGTGFFINDDGLALTNNHVLSDQEQGVVYYFNENGEVDRANSRKTGDVVLTNEDEKIDFTVFYVQLHNKEKVKYLPLVKNHIREGDEIAKMGCPNGLPCDFGMGTISNYFDGYFSHKIATNQGDSGGPIVNKKGEAIGVNQSIEMNESLTLLTGSFQKAEGIAYAVDCVLIRKCLDELNITYGQ